MEIGLRCLAIIIDAVICFCLYPLVMESTGWLLEKSGSFGIVLMPIWFVLFVVWPFIYLGVPTGLWGKTLGKLICRLSVKDHRGESPGVWRALGREVLKCLAIGSGIGAALTLFQIIFQGTTWYDDLCGTGVTFKPYVRLTPTQKKWRRVTGYKNK